MKIKNNLDEQIVINMKMIGIDQVQKANSGHPGIVLGAMPIIYTLLKYHLHFYVKEPSWINRDRLILSAGHGSALLYSALYMAGYDIKLEDLKKFRQLNSKTPGHPEYWDIPGIECTTGPLGQGLTFATGMALSENWLENNIKNNKLGSLYDNFTFVICGDGDLQEGISYEAMSFAGHLNLHKLIVLYDSNKIQLDGKTKNAISECTQKRVESQNWEYFRVKNGENIEEINSAIEKAKNSKTKKPKFIEINTIIGYGSPLKGTSKIHGAPMNDVDYQKTREFYNWKHEPFFVNENYKKTLSQNLYERSEIKYKLWFQKQKEFLKLMPEYSDLIKNIKKIPSYNEILEFIKKYEEISTRQLIGETLTALSNKYKWLFGGSADLSCSTKIGGADGLFEIDNIKGREIFYGVREHSMCSIANGIYLYGVFRSYTGTFLVFSDYAKPALRLAAIMKIAPIFFFSHDSIFVGEDGPTHEPIEQISMLRHIPNFSVWRPANKQEVSTSLIYSLNHKTQPNAIISSRQNFKQYFNENANYEDIVKGAYILKDFNSKVDLILMSSGSENALSFEVAKLLKQNNIYCRVISVPNLNLFNNQNIDYKNILLKNYNIPIIVIEATNCSLWYKYIKNINYKFEIKSFGASGNASDIRKHFKFDVNNIFEKIKVILNK